MKRLCMLAALTLLSCTTRKPQRPVNTVGRQVDVRIPASGMYSTATLMDVNGDDSVDVVSLYNRGVLMYDSRYVDLDTIHLQTFYARPMLLGEQRAYTQLRNALFEVNYWTRLGEYGKRN